MAFNFSTKTARIQVDDSRNVPASIIPALQNNTLNYGNRRALLDLAFTGSVTEFSQEVTGISAVIISQLYIGLPITGMNIPADTTILSISGTSLNMSNAATGTGGDEDLAVVEISLPIPVPLAGFPSFDYYQVYALSPNLITDPSGLLTYFKSCGYQVNYGNSGTQLVNNIIAFSPNPISSGNCTLFFSGQSLNLSTIANSIVSGTFSIGGTSITGTLVSITTGVFSETVTSIFTATTDGVTGILTSLSVDANLLMVGSGISGTGIPVGSTIVSINSSTSVTIDQNTTASGTPSVTYTSLLPTSCDTAIVVNSSDYTDMQIGEDLTINYVQQSGNPDANNTEPFIMNLWQSASAMGNLNGLNSNATVGAPGIYFIILPDAASTSFYQPTGDVMDLGVVPSTVSTVGSIVTLVIPSDASYASFIPAVTFGNTTITQATSLAVGTVFASVINGDTIQIQVNNVTGTFDTSNDLSLTLDNTVTIMSQQQTYFANNNLSLRTFPCIYEIFTQSDVNNILNPLATYIQNLNLPVTANAGQGNCSLVFGNQTLTPQQATSSWPTGFNNPLYDQVYFNYVQRAGVPYQAFAQTINAMATVFASNNYTFNPLNDILLNGFANSTLSQDWINVSPGGAADQLINLGVNVIATNQNAQQYLILGRSTQTNFNNNPDTEFYPTYVLDTKNYIRLQLIAICRSNGVGQVRQTPTVLKRIATDCITLNNQMGDNGGAQILRNTDLTNNLITVTNSPNNTLGVEIFFPIQQNPGLLYVYATVVNYSINISLG